jgi:hypothetical protein
MTIAEPPPPMLPALAAPRPRLHSDEDIAMKRNREEWDNEGGQVRVRPDDPEAAAAAGSSGIAAANFLGDARHVLVPIGLTVATVGIALAIAFQ